MKAVRLLVAALVTAATLAGSTQSQGPQPGPEHEHLKKMVGTWDAVMKAGGMEAKGVMTYKMDLGGLWLTSVYESEMAPGQKYNGRGYDSYDARKKKYVAIWIDSVSTSPMVMEGTFDEKTRTLTLFGEGPTPDGRMAMHRMTNTMKDDNSIEFAMYQGDSKQPNFTISYKRRK